MVVFLRWLCGGVFCDGVFCDGVFVVVFLWWCFSGGVCVVVWWCFGGVLVVFLWWCFCKDCHQTSPKVLLK